MDFTAFNQTISKIQLVYPPMEIISFLQYKFINTGFFYVDVWVFVHLFSGMLLRMITSNPVIATAVLIGFEIIEYGIFVQLALAQPESIINIVFDVAVGMVGWAIVHKFSQSEGFIEN